MNKEHRFQVNQIVEFLRLHGREEDAKFVENLVFDLNTAPSWKHVWALRDKIEALENIGQPS